MLCILTSNAYIQIPLLQTAYVWKTVGVIFPRREIFLVVALVWNTNELVLLLSRTPIGYTVRAYIKSRLDLDF